MNKQIEEMANEINEMDEPNAHYYTKNMVMREAFADCFTIAKHLYNAGYRKLPKNIGEFSDGYHTFNELYHHRAVLFSVICNAFPEKAWKSRLHDTGDMFEGMFIVGIETPDGQATYHYDIDPYWDMFNVKELERAPKWDGHTPAEAIQRIGNLSSAGFHKQSEGEWVVSKTEQAWNNGEYPIERTCSVCGLRRNIETQEAWNFCPNCGARMKGEQ